MKRRGLTWPTGLIGRIRPGHICAVAALTGAMALVALAGQGGVAGPGVAFASCPLPLMYESTYLERKEYAECVHEEALEHELQNKEFKERAREDAEKSEREQTASQPANRVRSTTQLSVRVHGCEYVPTWRVNDSRRAVGGNVAIKLFEWKPNLRVWKVEWTDIVAESHTFAGWFSVSEKPAGTYRFSTRFLGDSHLSASRSAAIAVFHIKHGCRHEPKS